MVVLFLQSLRETSRAVGLFRILATIVRSPLIHPWPQAHGLWRGLGPFSVQFDEAESRLSARGEAEAFYLGVRPGPRHALKGLPLSRAPLREGRTTVAFTSKVTFIRAPCMGRKPSLGGHFLLHAVRVHGDSLGSAPTCRFPSWDGLAVFPGKLQRKNLDHADLRQGADCGSFRASSKADCGCHGHGKTHSRPGPGFGGTLARGRVTKKGRNTCSQVRCDQREQRNEQPQGASLELVPPPAPSRKRWPELPRLREAEPPRAPPALPGARSTST